MELRYAFLAQSAEMASDGRFHVFGGGIDRIGAPQFPVVIPLVSLVAEVLFDHAECERIHNVEVRVTRPDGTRHEAAAQIEITPERDAFFPDAGATAHLVTGFGGFVIREAGRHDFHITVDGHDLGSCFLYAAQAE